VRTTIGPSSIVGEVSQAIWSLDRDQSLGMMRTLDEIVDLDLAQPRFRGVVLAGFAGMALLMTATGLYGLLSVLVSQRHREIGVRIALGALPGDILGLVMGKSLGVIAAGLATGLLLALGLVRLFSTLIYGISAVDPFTFVVCPFVLLAVASLASY